MVATHAHKKTFGCLWLRVGTEASKGIMWAWFILRTLQSGVSQSGNAGARI